MLFQEKNNGGLAHSREREEGDIWTVDAKCTSVRINKIFEFMDNFGVGGMLAKN